MRVPKNALRFWGPDSPLREQQWGQPKETTMHGRKLMCGASALFLLAGSCAATRAEDTLPIAAGLGGTWENSFSELGQNAGFFKKHGLTLEIFYTQGAGETQQAGIFGSPDIVTGGGAF